MKPGIIVMSELKGALAERVLEIQQRVDPRMARELPPHITITGSSGMGPIPPGVTDAMLSNVLAPITESIAPFQVRFGPPTRFMQSTVVVMLIDPNGPIRALHERIKSSGLPYEQPRFTFTPHLTLSFYPELNAERMRELTRVRIAEPLEIDAVQVYRAVDLTRTRKVLDLPLAGTPHPPS